VRGKKIDKHGVVRSDNRLAISIIGRVGKPRQPGVDFGQSKIAFGMIEAERVLFIHGADDKSVERDEHPLAVRQFTETILGSLFRRVFVCFDSEFRPQCTRFLADALQIQRTEAIEYVFLQRPPPI